MNGAALRPLLVILLVGLVGPALGVEAPAPETPWGAPCAATSTPEAEEAIALDARAGFVDDVKIRASPQPSSGSAVRRGAATVCVT